MLKNDTSQIQMTSQKDELLKVFSLRLRTILSKLEIDFTYLQEVRLRIHEPMIVVYENKEAFVTEDGRLTNEVEEGLVITKNELRETMEYVSNYSLYAFEEEIKQGFITISGGHRVGIVGRAVMEQEKVKSIKHVSFINIRLSHQVRGCATRVMPYIIREGEDCIYHTLIISPPKCGKTTLLRDMIRQISNGNLRCKGQNVGVVDERSELAACYMGAPQNDLGIRTDVLDCCPKAYGMMMLIRSMSPNVIAVDEIGSRDDLEAIEHVIRCGCSIVATVHGSSIKDIEAKPVLSELMRRNYFERYIVLSNLDGVGSIEHIYDGKGTVLL